MSLPPQSVIMTRDGTGWTFKHTRDHTDYTGTLTPDKDGDFIQQLLFAKPQVMDVAITNQDYKLSVSGEDIVMSIDLKCVFEVVEVVLRCDGSLGEVEVKRLKKRVGELEGEVEMLKMGGMRCVYINYGNWKEWQSMSVVDGKVINPAYDDQLVRYASAFHQPFISFLKDQINTTIAEAFVKWWVKLKNDALEVDDATTWWVESCGNKLEDNMCDYLTGLKTEYMARVHNLSMKLPRWHCAYEVKSKTGQWSYSYRRVSSNHIMADTNGLYVSGCWGASLAIDQPDSDLAGLDVIISGPFKSTPMVLPSRKYDTPEFSNDEFYLLLTPLTPLTPAQKLEHNLS